MKKLIILSCAVIALSSFMATTVRAQSAHYITGPTASLNGNDYCVSFKEAGLGNGAVTITYTLTAGEGTFFTYQCFTKSDNTPHGAPNSVSGNGVSTVSKITTHNGQITATVCLSPASLPQPNTGCQGGGLVLKLISVDYDNVTFSDNGTNQTFTLPDLPANS